MQRCTAIKSNGKLCRAPRLRGETKCVFHSDSKKALEARERQHSPKPVLTNQELILILQKELTRVRKKKGDVITRSTEIRQLISLIAELKGERPPTDSKTSSTFEKKIEKWQKKKNQQ